jgi:hypothetical protein
VIVLRAAAMSSLLLINLQRFRREGKFIDAKIGSRTEDTNYTPCHKVVLAAFSEYFESLLLSTDGAAMLSLEAVDPLYARQLASIFDYMYGVRLTLDERKINVIIDAAKVFGIHSLQTGELVRLRQTLLRTKHKQKYLKSKRNRFVADAAI